MLGAPPPEDLDQVSQPIDWEAYQHHRQAYLDRDQIADLEDLWRAASPDDLDELLRDAPSRSDVSLTETEDTDTDDVDDEDPPRWVFIL